MRRPFLLVVFLLSPVLAAQPDVCIDTAWMTSRSLIAQNDPALAESLVESLKPGPEGVYSLQWPLIAAETMWHTGNRGTWNAYMPREYLGLVKRFEDRAAENGLLNASGLVDWPKSLREGFDYEIAATSENAVLNAYYYGALHGFARMMEGIGRTPRPFVYRAGLIEQAFHEHLIDPDTGLVRDAPNSTHTSVHANAVAAAFGLIPDASRERVADFLYDTNLSAHPYLRPYVLEGLFRLGRLEQAMELAEAYAAHEHSIDTQFLVRRYALGLRPGRTAWKTVRLEPAIEPAFPHPLRDEIELESQRITLDYVPTVGIRLTVAPNTPVTAANNTGLSIMVKNAESHALDPLTDAQRDQLEVAGWPDHVGDARGVWIDVDAQMLRVIENNEVVYQARCATAIKGVGSQSGSYKTPTGWHTVAKAYGENAPWGQVFRARRPTREIWKPGDDVLEDLVLTRVLHLDGLEPGRNKGGSVDSYTRNIYIHGTNGEAVIGTPSSHGCIRMLNDDVIEFFPMAPEGTRVLITASEDAPAEAETGTD